MLIFSKLLKKNIYIKLNTNVFSKELNYYLIFDISFNFDFMY